MTGTYRKKPIPVQARQLTADSYRGLIDALTPEQFVAGGETADGTVFLEIRTLEGQLRASEGDWIIWGPRGDVWPVRGDIFAETYEPVYAEEATAEERIARHLAADDYCAPDEEADDDWWNNRPAKFRQDYLARARRVIALVRAEAQPTTQPETETLAAMFEGLGRLLATSSRDWGLYAPDAWLYAVVLGWDCEQEEHDETCTHGVMEEMQERHGWSDEAVAKARRYRAAVRALTASFTEAQPSTRHETEARDVPDARPGTTDYTLTHGAAKVKPAADGWCGATEIVPDREVQRLASTGLVGYQQDHGRLLHCLHHKPAPASRYVDFHEVTADDLPEGGICVHPRCGADLLAMQRAAGVRQDGAQPS